MYQRTLTPSNPRSCAEGRDTVADPGRGQQHMLRKSQDASNQGQVEGSRRKEREKLPKNGAWAESESTSVQRGQRLGKGPTEQRSSYAHSGAARAYSLRTRETTGRGKVRLMSSPQRSRCGVWNQAPAHQGPHPALPLDKQVTMGESSHPHNTYMA